MSAGRWHGGPVGGLANRRRNDVRGVEWLLGVLEEGFPGAFHGSDITAPGARASVRMVDERMEALRRAFYLQPAIV